MTISIADIRSADWSPELGNPGEVVQDNDDIEQCITIILTTAKGSDPHRPLFGCDAWLRLDAPPAVAVPTMLVDIADALALWEPRIALISVDPVMNSASAATLTVAWRRLGSTTTHRTEVAIGNPA